MDDFAHAVWCFADLTEADVALAEQVRKTRIMCDAYGGITPAGVVETLTARFHRARAQHLAAGRQGGVRVFDDLLRWMAHFGGRIARQLTPHDRLRRIPARQGIHYPHRPRTAGAHSCRVECVRL